MAKYLHISAIVFVPDFMDRATQQKIESEGAEVVVVDGDYDHSIECAKAEADKGGMLVMDVSWEGYEVIPEVLIPYRIPPEKADIDSGLLKAILPCLRRLTSNCKIWALVELHTQ
jgi:hypothetical protein